MIVFDYHGTPLATFLHLYNLTYLNERCVELAVARWWLGDVDPFRLKSGLEVGNVLGHYWPLRHTVFDLYEPAAWYQELAGQPVYDVDLLATAGWESRPLFPWVVSLSTIEHTDNPMAALDALRGLVAPGGRLLVSWPTGVNDDLDSIVRGCWDWSRCCTVSRVAGGLEWATDPEPVVSLYGEWANTVYLAEWEAPPA